MRCLFVFHRWVEMKWGYKADLDCRECSRCGRFEIWAYTRFYRAERRNFKDVVPA